MSEYSRNSLSINEISTGAQLAIFSLRQWQINRGDPDALETTLKPFYKKLNVNQALDAFLVLSGQFDHFGDDPLVANCPCQHSLHDNELRFLEWLMVDGDSGSLETALKDSSRARDTARQTAVKFSAALAPTRTYNRAFLNFRSIQRKFGPSQTDRKRIVCAELSIRNAIFAGISALAQACNTLCFHRPCL